MNQPSDAHMAEQSKCMQRVKSSLGRPTLTPLEARDAFLDCLVVSYLEGTKAGVKGPVDAEADPQEVARVAKGILRRRLANYPRYRFWTMRRSNARATQKSRWRRCLAWSR